MRVILYFMGGVIAGILAALYFYLTIAERKEKKLNDLLSKKLEDLLENTTVKISERQKELKRVLTEDEKNKILDECYLLIK